MEGTKVNLSVELTFLNQNEAPFKYLEFVELDEFEIRDAVGNVVVSAEDADAIHSINNGKVQLQLAVEGKLEKGESYTLVVECFEGLKKADAPLEIKGDWECEFMVK